MNSEFPTSHVCHRAAAQWRVRAAGGVTEMKAPFSDLETPSALNPTAPSAAHTLSLKQQTSLESGIHYT